MRKRTAVVAGMALAFILFGSMPCTSTAAPPVLLDQGPSWTQEARTDFYNRDQGSKIMPLKWIAALKQPNGNPFLEGSLDRYGYLPNDASVPPGLPVGFTVSSGSGGQVIGMTCSACHTRQIEVSGASYRVDGGPAISDFQGFLADLDVAVGSVLATPAAFSDFARAVLGATPAPDRVTELKAAVSDWYTRFHTLTSRALPQTPWGPGRLDAVSMIFNRLAGLDIGPPPLYMIPENIAPADAPVRYPFVWNAPIQDKTQWPGFADNGSNILGLSRNLGEVLGVFADFHPTKDGGSLLGIDYADQNSANFRGLNALEDLLRRIGPPKWPWTVDRALAGRGKTVFEQTCATGCHEIKRGEPRSLFSETWATPVQDVGTDSRQVRNVLPRKVDAGVLSGATIPFMDPIAPTDKAINVLGASVLGSILQHYLPIVEPALPFAIPMDAQDNARRLLFAPGTEFLNDLRGAFRTQYAEAGGEFRYESRVLRGIWAAAPYLHNGSVPTLAELLKPDSQRVASFKIGPAYDPVAVGLAVDQTKFNATLVTTDCAERNSGNSRCGHSGARFGTELSAQDKKALLEYLKTL